MTHEPLDPESRSTALIASVVVPMLLLALPLQIRPVAVWLLPAISYPLLAATTAAHYYDKPKLNQILGFALAILFTVFTILALGELIEELIIDHGRDLHGGDLLKSATLLWLSNILVFAMWYWRLDAGGPNARDRRSHHRCGAFLFPQMGMAPEELGAPWRPGFMDYLFLAFNTSTAFSPTDSAPLTRQAKAAMMVQSLISLAIIALVAARGVNIL